MKRGRLGDLIAIGHAFFLVAGDGGDGSRGGPRGPGFLLSLEKNTTLCSCQLPVSCHRTISTGRDLEVHCIPVVTSAVYHPC